MKHLDEHPSFGMIGVSRVSSGGDGQSLFQSSVKHQHFVTLRVKRAARNRSLHRDWVMAREPIVEVMMSFAQWAEFVSSMNQGDGVPCTIYSVEYEKQEQTPFESRLAVSAAETKDAAKVASEEILEASRAVLAAFNANAGRKDMREVLETLERKIDQFPGNVKFASDSLSSHVEKTVAHAKADLEAHVAQAAKRLGLSSDFMKPAALEIEAGDQ